MIDNVRSVVVRARRAARVAVALGALLVATGCPFTDGAGHDPAVGEGPPATAPAARAPITAPRVPVTFAGEMSLRGRLANPDRCEHFSDECLLPFPSDRFTRVDTLSDTGRRVALDPASMSVSTRGVPIDPTEWNRQDGFSPGSPIVFRVRGLDLGRTGAATRDEPQRSLAPDAPFVLLDANTGERLPYLVELDAAAHLQLAGADESRRAVIIRPLRNFRDGHRIVVALRNLRDALGQTLEAPAAFRALRDRLRTDEPALEERRTDMEDTFAQLGAAGVGRDDLYLAWSFTVASTRNLTERMLTLRDLAFADLGGRAPAVAVTNVVPTPEDGVSRVVEGTVDVPRFLTGDEPTAVFANAEDPDGIPHRTGTVQARFTCVVPTQAESRPADIVLTAPDILTDSGSVRGVGGMLARRAGVATCATDQWGFSARDARALLDMMGELSRFRSLPDQLQQGMLNSLVLARALSHPEGLRADPALRRADGTSMLGSKLGFAALGDSGTFAGALAALGQDWDRVAFVGAGMNASTMFDRSATFAPLHAVIHQNYPDPLRQQVGFALFQMLWDRGELNGYANHLTTDPLPGTRPKKVLVVEALGDQKVANLATRTLARTVGARVRVPTLPEGRVSEPEPFWGLEPARTVSGEGSRLVEYDFGGPPAPAENVARTDGADPHSALLADPSVLDLTAAYLFGDDVPDPCPGRPCPSPH